MKTTMKELEWHRIVLFKENDEYPVFFLDGSFKKKRRGKDYLLLPEDSHQQIKQKNFNLRNCWVITIDFFPIYLDTQHLSFAPNETRKMWTYATCGMSNHTDGQLLELHIFSQNADNNLVELLTVIAHFHRYTSTLWLHHTVNFGRPWLNGSKCDHGLISLPYLDGPSIEWLAMGEKKARFLWLIPITKKEVDYKKKYGIKALEEKLERIQFDYLDISRNSAV